EVSEPLFGMASYAWGGEWLVLGDIKLPRQPVYVELTEQGFNISDKNGKVLIEKGRFGKRLTFTAYGESSHLQLQNAIGNPGTRFKLEQNSLYSTYVDLKKALEIDQSGKQSQFISIALEHPDRQFAKTFVNAIAQTYLKRNSNRHSSDSAETLSYLEKQLVELRDSMQEAENELREYQITDDDEIFSLEVQELVDDAVRLQVQLLGLEYGYKSLGEKTDNNELAVLLTQQSKLDASLNK